MQHWVYFLKRIVYQAGDDVVCHGNIAPAENAHMIRDANYSQIELMLNASAPVVLCLGEVSNRTESGSYKIFADKGPVGRCVSDCDLGIYCWFYEAGTLTIFIDYMWYALNCFGILEQFSYRLLQSIL